MLWRGLTASMHNSCRPKPAREIAGREFRYYCKGLGQGLLAKMHPHNLFIDNDAVSCDFLEERETQIDSLSGGFPRSGCGTISTDTSR